MHSDLLSHLYPFARVNDQPNKPNKQEELFPTSLFRQGDPELFNCLFLRHNLFVRIDLEPE